MDGERFDRIVRNLPAATRRGGLRALLGGAIALAFGGTEADARRRKCKPPCDPGFACVKGECVCPSGRGWVWTRKRAGIPIRGTIEAGGRTWKVDGRGVDDETAGYHTRHTAWLWSAGIGTDTEGRPVAWNLVSGVNSPPERSERTIWVEGHPREVAPVVFHDLDGVSFEAGPDLDFHFRDDAERLRDDDFGLIRSHYLHRFGTFTGAVDGIELAEGAGVMEECRAAW